MENDPMLFMKKSFLLEDGSDMKQWVYDRFQTRVSACDWNNSDVRFFLFPGRFFFVRKIERGVIFNFYFSYAQLVRPVSFGGLNFFFAHVILASRDTPSDPWYFCGNRQKNLYHRICQSFNPGMYFFRKKKNSRKREEGDYSRSTAEKCFENFFFLLI
jgi:hypothetical protein